MIVKDKMTVNPYCISKDTTISKALNVMEEGNFHRVPIVDGKILIGLITEGIIAENTPSKATSLSIHELNYLLSKNTVENMMVKDVITITEKQPLVEAAVLMRQYDIGCLVVVNDKYEVVGIITQNDIFEAFIDLLGYNEKGDKFNILIKDDKPGVLADLTNLFFAQNATITSLAVHHKESEIEVVIRADNVDKDSMKKLLFEKNYKLL